MIFVTKIKNYFSNMLNRNKNNCSNLNLEIDQIQNNQNLIQNNQKDNQIQNNQINLNEDKINYNKILENIENYNCKQKELHLLNNESILYLIQNKKEYFRKNILKNLSGKQICYFNKDILKLLEDEDIKILNELQRLELNISYLNEKTKKILIELIIYQLPNKYYTDIFKNIYKMIQFNGKKIQDINENKVIKMYYHKYSADYNFNAADCLKLYILIPSREKDSHQLESKIFFQLISVDDLKQIPNIFRINLKEENEDHLNIIIVDELRFAFDDNCLNEDQKKFMESISSIESDLVFEFYNKQKYTSFLKQNYSFDLFIKQINDKQNIDIKKCIKIFFQLLDEISLVTFLETNQPIILKEKNIFTIKIKNNEQEITTSLKIDSIRRQQLMTSYIDNNKKFNINNN